MDDAAATTTTPPAATPEATPPPAEPPKQDPPDQNLVGEAKRKQREAEKEAQDLRERLQALEDKDKSELERERAQRERLQADLADREQRLVKAERGGWVRDAATEAKFHDPTDAVARANLSEIESEADAKRFVTALAKDKKHLVQQEPERPQIGQVLQDGRVTDPATAQAVTAAAQKAEGEQFVQELRDAIGKGSTSIPGLLDSP